MCFLFLFILTYTSYSQILRWTPYFAADQDSLVITYDATKGNGGLAGYTGDVYAHTGVITNLSTSGSDWKYVKTNWGQNTPETKLTRIGTDLYQYKIKPSVRSFYGVPSNETILKVAFVFRSAFSPYLEGKTEEGGDIFLPLISPGQLNVAFVTPTSFPIIKQPNDTIRIEVVSIYSNNLSLYEGSNLLTQTSGTSLIYNYIPTSSGKKMIKAIATGTGGSTKADSFYVIVRPTVTIQALPNGIVDGINYTSPVSATLSLFAPQKSFVYVIGDFTNWEIDPNYYMKRTPDGNRYWIELSNLSPSVEYGFQYFVDGVLRVADPYCDKILDPWNDKYIPATVYPNLKPYPTGKTTQIVSVLQTAQTSYNWHITNFQKPKKDDLVIYELLIRDFIQEHSYQSLIDTLSYFKTLGVNAIELMPITEFEGNESWGYNPMFMLAPDKYYGTKNKLKEFIDSAHQNGIAVILDVVLNHQMGNSPLARLYWDAANNRPAANNPWFNQIATHPYNVGNDFNHESQATKDFVDRVVKYWITEYKFDGYRFDLSKGFTQFNSGGNVGLWGQYDQSRVNIWNRIFYYIKSIDSTAYVILEHFADNSEETVLQNSGMMFWGNLNFNYNEATMGWNSNSDFSWGSYKARGWTKPNLITYMESHDEERLMYKNLQYGNSSGNYNIKDLRVALNRIKLASAFFFTIPGGKMIWQFGELGYDFSIDYGCRVCNKPIRWDYYSDHARIKLYKVFSSLIKLKKNYDAFRSSDFTLAVSGPTKRISINHSSMKINIIGNFDVVTQNVNPNFQNTGTWYEYFSHTGLSVNNINDPIQLLPGEFKLYTTTQLPAPEPGLLNDLYEDAGVLPKEYNLEQNYPNPFNPTTKIKYSIKNTLQVVLKVYDILGNEVATLVNEVKRPGIYTAEFNGNGLSSGVYFYKLQTEDFVSTKKLLLMK
jgi:1,4-alpha-glucan branching enzyme